jgi:hypothetical protein
MRVFRRVFAAIVWTSLSTLAHADSASHQRAAEEFYAVAVAEDPRALAKLVAEMIAGLRPELQQHREILQDFATELVSSKDYVDAQVRVYAELFTEEELRALTGLFGTPTMKKYRSLRIQLVRRSSEEAIASVKESLPALARRIRENTQSADPADR